MNGFITRVVRGGISLSLSLSLSLSGEIFCRCCHSSIVYFYQCVVALPGFSISDNYLLSSSSKSSLASPALSPLILLLLRCCKCAFVRIFAFVCVCSSGVDAGGNERVLFSFFSFAGSVE